MARIVPGKADEVGVAGPDILLGVVVAVFDINTPSRHLVAKCDVLSASHVRDTNLSLKL